MFVEEQMMKNIRSCRTSDSLATAAKVLWDNDCGCVPVIDDDDRLHGMLTDRDICMAAFTTGKSLAELQVGDVMAKDVASTWPSESLEEAELTMRVHAVRRLPVLDEQNRLVGLLTCNDLIRWVDDGGANGSVRHAAVHLVHTLATIGRSRQAQPDCAVPARDRLPQSAPASSTPPVAGSPLPVAAK